MKRIFLWVTVVALVAGLFMVPAPVAQANDTTTITVKLLDYNGDGLAGGTARYAVGGTWIGLPGTTDSNGLIVTEIPYSSVNVKVEITYNQGSRAITQYVPTYTVYLFQTVEATVKLIDHAGNGLSGGKVDQGGATWVHHGYTDASGEFKLEMFPGSYKFRLGYNHTSQQKTQNISTPVTFQTGKVTITCTGTVQLSLGGSWYSYPSGTVLQLLPGTYNYKGACGSGSINVTASGQVTIPITTNQPPVVNSVTANPNQLWPPNHKAVDVTITVHATDPDGDEDIVSITYSVADEYGIYDVAETDLPEDGVISLIAWRDGEDKDGRVYTVTVTVYDAEGLSDGGSVDVVVPHDQGKRGK